MKSIYTIADFVADLRAPTPTGAAEMAVPNINDVLNYLNQINIRINTSINNILKSKSKSLNSICDSPIIRNPISIYEVKEQKFDNTYERLINGYSNIIEKNKYTLDTIKTSLNVSINNVLIANKHSYIKILSKLEVLNPLLTLKRGYSIVKKDNKVIDSINKLSKGNKIDIELQDGNIKAEII